MHLILKRFEMSIVFFLKISLYFVVFLTFYYLFALRNQQMLKITRTTAVILSTFVIVGLAMVSIYGKYDIGKRKSKPIIYSLALAVIVTDIVTYLELSIMNTNPANNNTFKIEFVDILMLVMVVQVVEIIIFTYGGNYVYFRINPPEKCVVITDSQDSLDLIMRGIKKFKKQFKVIAVVDYNDADIERKIMRSDTAFLYNVPVKERTKLVEFCYENLRNVYFNPETSDVVEINAEHFIFDDISMIGAEFKGLSFEQRFVKRFMDVFASIACLIITSPLFIIVSLLIKINDGGKIFFTQKRATKDGKIFKVYKFRTMKENNSNHSVVEDDDRITFIGKFLRKYRIDELPQFINILLGDMSLVGPRPEMLSNMFQYMEDLPEFEYRLRVKAGLTGYAQIAGKYNTTPKDKLILDLMYIEDYSLLLDIKLLFQTLIVLVKTDSTEAFSEDSEQFIKFKKFINSGQDK